MSATGLSVFDTTVDKTNVMLNEIQDQLPAANHQQAWQALRAVLHALRDRLTIEEAADFAAQLPLLVRGLYYEGWHPAGKPLKERKKEEFLNHVSQGLSSLDMEPEETTRAVFQVLAHHVTRGEVRDVKHVLPREIRELWTAAAF